MNIIKLNNWFIHEFDYDSEFVKTHNEHYGTNVDTVQILCGQRDTTHILERGEPWRTSMVVEIHDDHVITLNNKYELGEPADDDCILYLKARLGLW